MNKKYNVTHTKPNLTKEELEKKKQEILYKICIALNTKVNYTKNKG